MGTQKKITNKRIIVIMVAFHLLAFIIFLSPIIPEFPVFNCITEPCIEPRISIIQYIDREYFPEPYQIPDCFQEAC